jgi:hypothetical protein
MLKNKCYGIKKKLQKDLENQRGMFFALLLSIIAIEWNTQKTTAVILPVKPGSAVDKDVIINTQPTKPVKNILTPPPVPEILEIVNQKGKIEFVEIDRSALPVLDEAIVKAIKNPPYW